MDEPPASPSAVALGPPPAPTAPEMAMKEDGDGIQGSTGPLAPCPGPQEAPRANDNEKEADSIDTSGSGAGTTTGPVGVHAELQCTLCHDVLFKPITTRCGHSFCRVCLMDFFLAQNLLDTQCPICRGEVLFTTPEPHDGETPTSPLFNISVTLWNLIQQLVPVVKGRNEPEEEEEEYALKRDRLEAKWRMAALQGLPSAHRRRNRVHSDVSQAASDVDEEIGDDNDEAGRQWRQRRRFPVLRVEHSVDGHLAVERCVVRDSDDENIDGYQAMRVGMSVMEFPSLFQLYNEHQECAIALVRLEEDEELDDGMPFFMSESGDDDDFIISDYYNHVTLRVKDDGGNVIMERIRAAQQGIVTFPQLRLDVPAGTYTFHFSDDLFGAFLSITTELRDPSDERDGELDEENYISLIQDEAGERGGRRRGRRRESESDEDEHDDGSESDDSFIVNDDEDADVQGQFSDDDHEHGDSGDDRISIGSDEDEEDVLERIERRRQLDQGDDMNANDHVQETTAIVDDDQDASDCAKRPSLRVQRRKHIVDDDESEQSDEELRDHQSDDTQAQLVANRKRNRAIVDSDDGDDEEEDPGRIVERAVQHIRKSARLEDSDEEGSQDTGKYNPQIFNNEGSSDHDEDDGQHDEQDCDNSDPDVVENDEVITDDEEDQDDLEMEGRDVEENYVEDVEFDGEDVNDLGEFSDYE